MPSPIYITEQAKVYRVGNRRFFTRRAAIFAYARQRVRQKHRPESGDKEEWSEWLLARGKATEHRYAKMLMRKLRRRHAAR